ncbi:hypothetical protein KCU71_g11693, partial [Aureobasidium melanogenum]
MTTLKAATESCMRGFAVICHTTEDTRSESSCCNDLKEEFGRFRIWTGNLGALAKGHSALDWRLRDADVMRATVLSLLEELQNTLELASDLVVHGPTEAFFGAEPTHDDHLPDDISLPSDDELDAISPPESSLSIFIQRIQEQVKDLYKLSFRIRTSALKPARAIHYKEIDATSGLDIFGDCFAPHDKSHVYELFRSLRPHHSIFNEDDDLLVQRFAKANTARRRQFRYWYKHAQKLTATDISEPVVMKEVAVDVQPRQGPVKTYTAPRPRTGTQTSQSHHGKTIFTTTEATFFDPKLDLSSLETQSIISSATTARDLEGKPAELPPPPAAALDGHDFVCPYCFVLCPSPHGQGRAWRKHILQDLQPYLCTQVNCSSADRLYGSRREWLEHEEAQHRRVWQAFEQHLRDEDHGNVTETQIKDFASIAQSTANDLREQCPICLEDATSIPQFSAHLAHHMERIAIFSIPRGLDDGGLMSLASFKAVPRSMSDRTSISLGFSSLASKNSTKDVDPVLDGGIPFNDDRTGASPTPGSDTEAKAKLVTRENLDRTALDLANDPDELQVLTVTQDTLSESIQEQRNNILESTANRTIASNVSVQGPTAHSSDLSSQDHSGSAKDEIVAWLQSFASLRMSNLSYMPLETGEYQRFLEDPSFVSWCTGSRPRRIVCYGLDDVRNTMFTSMIYDHLTQNLPEVPIVLCQMPGPFPRDLEAKDILTSILGQLIAHKSVETIPTELLRLYGGHELPREELSQAAVVGNRVAYDMRAPGFEEVSGFGPLHVCSIFGLKSLINRLLVTNPDIGAEVDSQTHTRSMTPLMYAASVGHLETLVLLLEQGANPYLTNAEGSTAMFEALMNRRHDVLMHFLTSTTIEPHTVTSGGIRHTALMHIRFFTSIESVRALLGRQDIDVNESDEQGFTVLSHILFDPKPRQPGWTVDVARLILAVPGFETHAVDKMHRSYIQQLLQSPGFDEDLLEILLATDVDLENRDRAGETAIFYAICNQPKTKAAHMLLEHGANMTVRNYADTGLIHVGYYMDESDAMSSVRALLELVPDCINDQDSWGRTALHRALFLGQMELTRVLLTYTPDVEIRDNYGRTAFDVACQYGRFDVPDHDDADWLPSKKSTPDQTALSEAQLTPRGTLSPLPLPAWSLAFTWDLAQLRQKFKDGKLDMLEASPDDQNTALHLLMTSDPETTNTLKEILEVHFKTSNECSPRNIEGETPLHIAIQKNNIEIAKILIRNSADLQVQDSSGKTPLDLAKALERSAITTLIRQVLDDVSDSPK